MSNRFADNIFFATVYFLASGAIAFFFLDKFSLAAVMQFIALLFVILIVIVKFLHFRINQEKPVIYMIGLFPAVLFIYLLIFSTGGIGSPFLIMTHFMVIAAAFLLSVQIAAALVISTIVLLVGSIVFNQSAQAVIAASPLVSALYFLAYIILIPFSYVLAREYKIKDEWAQLLEKQITTSKIQEEDLLKNIIEAVVALDGKLNIVYQNQAAVKFSNYKDEIIGKNFMKVFTFKDGDGRDLSAYSLPIAQTLSSKVSSIVENIQISTKDGQFRRADLKILPVMSDKGLLGLVLILIDRSGREQAKFRKESVTSIALDRFRLFLQDQKETLQSFEKSPLDKKRLKKLYQQNEKLKHLAEDFIYSLRLESGEVGAISALFDLGELLESLAEQFWDKAGEHGVFLHLPNSSGKPQFISPGSEFKLKIAKRNFPTVFILGNVAWARDSLNRFLQLSLILCKKGKEIKIELLREGKIVRVNFSFEHVSIADSLVEHLFDKFCGNLPLTSVLAETSGLEGYIAKNLIERMGGAVKASIDKSTGMFNFAVTFGLQDKD